MPNCLLVGTPAAYDFLLSQYKHPQHRINKLVIQAAFGEYLPCDWFGNTSISVYTLMHVYVCLLFTRSGIDFVKIKYYYEITKFNKNSRYLNVQRISSYLHQKLINVSEYLSCTCTI